MASWGPASDHRNQIQGESELGPLTRSGVLAEASWRLSTSSPLEERVRHLLGFTNAMQSVFSREDGKRSKVFALEEDRYLGWGALGGSDTFFAFSLCLLET